MVASTVVAADRAPGAAVLARTPRPSPEAVATALAHALLAADEWTPAGMLAALQYSCGARRRWLPALVSEVLATYRTAPRDDPRQLAAVIRRSAAFEAVLARARAQRRPLVLAHWIAQPEPDAPSADATASAGVISRESSSPLPRLPTVDALAALIGVKAGQLDWLADVGGWNRRARPGPLHHYRYEWRARAGRTPRLLEIPSDRMLASQRMLLHELLALLPVHSSAHGFVPGRSAVTGARVHTGAAVVITLDLTTFFARVGAGEVYGALRRAGYGERVALALTGLVTNRVPPRVIAAMPAGGGADERFALRQALAAAHLPQGAPSSPALANLCVRRLDARLEGYAARLDARYTRYADDLTFSGPPDLGRRSEAFLRGVRRIVEAERHVINGRKTRVRTAARSQRVTGIVVNEHPALPRGEFDRLKAILHNCVTSGPETQNRLQHPDFRAHLEGRLSWAKALDPAKAGRLQREFDRIDWSATREAE